MVASHLVQVAWNGLIQYETRSADSSFVQYILKNSSKKVEVPQRYKVIANNIYEILQIFQNEYLTITEIKTLIENYRTGSHLKFDKSRISTVLNIMEREGIAMRQFFSKDKQIEINLSPEQRSLFQELVTLIANFQDTEVNIENEGTILCQRIIFDTFKVSKLFDIVQKASTQKNLRPVEETHNCIVHTISANPDINMHEVLDKLKREGLDFL